MNKPGDNQGEYREDCVFCQNYVPHRHHKIERRTDAPRRTG